MLDRGCDLVENCVSSREKEIYKTMIGAEESVELRLSTVYKYSDQGS